MNEFGSSDLIDHLCHCRLREPYLIGRFGVAKKLFRCRVAADGHDLFFRASGLGEPSACRLAQPVRLASLLQSGGVAPLSKLFAERIASPTASLNFYR
jgi:hypothetical protein